MTEEELKLQNAADYEVARILFDKDMSASASYKVHKNGTVVIIFEESVTYARYNDVVKTLRSSKVIKGVRAEQEGHEVCPLRL